MASQLSENLGDFTPTTKNTFLTFEFMPTHVAPRCSSVPRSSRLCHDVHLSVSNSKLLVVDTDASTYETDSESGTKTPMSLEGLSSYASPCASPRQANVYPQNSLLSDVSSQKTDSGSGARTPKSRQSYISPPQQVHVYPQSSCFTPTPAPHVAPPPEPHGQPRPLNSKAAAFASANQFHRSTADQRLGSQVVAFQRKDVAQVHEMRHQHYGKNIGELIHETAVMVKRSGQVRDVQISEDGGSWYVTIQPKVIGEDNVQNELLVALAKEALLHAASKSKSIYVLGYCAPEPFSLSVQGFQATLGVMQNAGSACWHIFKKGFCGHGSNCCKQHPAHHIPVKFLVEGVQLKPCAFFSSVFKVQAADLALTVTVALGETHPVEFAEAFKDKDYQGWTIELTANEDLAMNRDYKDYLLTLAKNTLFGASGSSELLYIIGYAEKPFQWKPRGFVAILGDMQDEASACWDMYSKGMCTRACGACQWAHPECLMPFNVIVKETSYAAIEG